MEHLSKNYKECPNKHENSHPLKCLSFSLKCSLSKIHEFRNETVLIALVRSGQHYLSVANSIIFSGISSNRIFHLYC